MVLSRIDHGFPVSASRKGPGRKALSILCLTAALTFGGAGGAAAGGLDPSFGTDGHVFSDFGRVEAAAGAIALAPDGSLWVAGSQCSWPVAQERSCDLALALYDTKGNELRRTPDGFSAHPDLAIQDLAVDSDGAAILVGRSRSAEATPELVRFLPNGAADPGFGAAALPQAFAVKEIMAVTIDASGRILLVGAGERTDVLIARLDPDGTADESFGGGDGVAIFQRQSGQPYVSELAVDREGRIFLGGLAAAGEYVSAMAAALNPDGEQAADLSAPLHLGSTSVRDLNLDGRGRVLLSIEGDEERPLQVVRLLPDGAIDESFGHNGIATMPSCEDCGVATALAVDSVDRPLFAGSPFRLGRFTAAGMPDERLARGGSVRVDFGDTGRLEATDLAIDGAGRAVVLGFRIIPGGHSQFIVARLLVDPGPVDNCRGVAATIVGTPMDDGLVGTTGRDVVLARGGADEIRGLGGGDLICAGRGADLLNGGADRDRIFGGNGADQIDGGPGPDRLLGGAGRDSIRGGAGADLLQGSGGADLLLGQSGPDRLFGGAGDDDFSGGPGKDVVRGGPCRSAISHRHPWNRVSPAWSTRQPSATTLEETCGSPSRPRPGGR